MTDYSCYVVQENLNVFIICWRYQDMEETISQKATSLNKLKKKTVRYTELQQFKESDHHKGYFCYNCIYFMKPSSCAIVSSQGLDFNGNSSGIIAPHGICSIWEPNEKEIH
jgi:hypothetical protein